MSGIYDVQPEKGISRHKVDPSPLHREKSPVVRTISFKSSIVCTRFASNLSPDCILVRMSSSGDIITAATNRAVLPATTGLYY